MPAPLRAALAWLFGSLAAAAIAVTVTSTIRSNQGWIRVLDFPRLLELIAIGVIGLGCAIFLRRWRCTFLGALLLAAGWQVWRIYPYIAGVGTEVVQADDLNDIEPSSCFSAFGLNVLQFNRNYAATIAAIDREQPDVLLLMETDNRWEQALSKVLRRYPYRLLRPIDNTYGMLFATKLPVRSARVVNITDQNTPTIYARLVTRDGRPFDYIGLHPRPPFPGQDTARRDAKIERAALATGGDDHMPAMAMGDFNDVAWSHTTQLFKKVGGFLDPRIGRGSYPTFPADYAAVGWPLDQMFVSPDFTFRGLRVLENVGSDHRPLAAELCLPRTRPAGNASVQGSEAARAKAREAVNAIR